MSGVAAVRGTIPSPLPYSPDIFTHTRSHGLLAPRRHWGIPIPALHCRQCGKAQLNEEVVAAVSNGVEKNGIDYWEQVRRPSWFSWRRIRMILTLLASGAAG
jgi:hypothetical protein